MAMVARVADIVVDLCQVAGRRGISLKQQVGICTARATWRVVFKVNTVSLHAGEHGNHGAIYRVRVPLVHC